MSLELNCAGFRDEETGELTIPPAGAKKYYFSIGRKNLKRLAETNNKVVIPAPNIEKIEGIEGKEGKEGNEKV